MNIQKLLKNKKVHSIFGGVAVVAMTLLVTFTSILPHPSLLQTIVIGTPTGFYAWPATPNVANPALFDVTLTWWPAVGATGYNVKSSQNPGGPYVTVLSPTSAVCQFDNTYLQDVCKVTFYAVQPGTYYDVISATSASIESNNSAPELKVVIASAGKATCSGTQVPPVAGDTKLKVNVTATVTGVNQSDITSITWTSVSLLPSNPLPANGATSQMTYDVALLDQVQAVGAAATVIANGQTIKSPLCSINLVAPPNPGSPPAPPAPPAPPTPPTPPPPTPPPVQQSQEETPLKPAKNIMTCKAGGEVLNRATEQPIYVHCGFTQASIVNAFVVSGDYDPKQDPTTDNAVKHFLNEESQDMKPLVVTWDGVNDYDTAVENGEYSLVVSAAPSKAYTPDYSILKFTVTDEPLPKPTQEQTTTTDTSMDVAPEVNPQTQPEQPTLPEDQEEPVEPSKCPGVNYPTDIKNHWAENFIKTSYDECLLNGYRDGTFHPDQKITRAEAVKLVLASINEKPKVCFDNDCGTPYSDLDSWQGPWIRPAWDKKIIDKTGKYFESNKPITRAEASSLVVKGFKFPVPAFCYTANCGAGFPDNFFIDIKQAWQGPYIRSLWDKKIIQGTDPGMFEPNRSITRAELTKIIISARESIKAPK